MVCLCVGEGGGGLVKVAFKRDCYIVSASWTSCPGTTETGGPSGAGVGKGLGWFCRVYHALHE